MPRYVAFLRALNVGGAHTVKMELLRHIFEELGFSNVQSFIASGNIIFDAPSRSRPALEAQIEAALMKTLGYGVTPFVRNGAELEQIAAFEPFPKTTFVTGDQLAVVFLPAPPGAKARAALKALQFVTDDFQFRGSELYWLRHTTVEGAAYSTVPLDKALDQPFTIRSMSTLHKIADKYFSHE
jgi:uncharacterized protein (DUF1697 family)